MKVNVIGVPLNLGCGRLGAEKTPDRLREKGLLEIIRGNGHRVFDLGNVYIPPVSEEEKFSRNKNMKYLDAIAEVNHNLAELVHSTLSGGGFPLTIGGDHSLGVGTVSGAGTYLDDFAVIWMDAHGDINTAETSPSGNVHGMSLSALMGIGVTELVDVYAPGQKVRPENVFLVGTRSLDVGEEELIRRESLNVYSMEQIRREGMSAVTADVLERLRERGIRNIHLSLDVDCFDPEYIPGTGTPVEEGITPDEFYEFADALLSAGLIRSMGLVEANLDFDKGDQTATLCLDIVNYVTSKI